MTRRKLIIILGLTAVLGIGAWVGGRLIHRHTVVARHLPPVPRLESWPPVLSDQIADAGRQARSWRHATAGLVALSRLYHANGFYPEALLCYQGLQTLEPGEARWPHLAASILAIFGRLEQARSLLQHAVALAPTYAPAGVRLGDVLLKDNQTAEAGRVYTDTLKHNPGHPYALLGLARCAIARGDWTAARRRLDEAIAQHPDFIGALSLQVTVSEHFGDQTTAAALRETIGRREFTDVPDPWLDELAAVCFDAYRLSVTAAIANSAGKPAEALALLDAAIALAPAVSSYRRQAGQIHLNRGDFAAARPQLEQAVAANPADSDAWLLLIKAQRGLGQDQAAMSTLLLALSRCPRSPSLHLEHARWLKAAGRNEEAIAEFRRGYELRPSDASALVELAGACFAAGRNPEAVEALQLALERQPGHPMALATLTFYAISLRDEPGALRHWAQVRNQPKTPAAVVDGLRRAYRQQFGRDLP